jgi:tetratricopeptide (TPR) repeat protein
MNYRRIFLIALLLNGTFLSTAFGQKQAKIYEAPLTIPTYEVRPPEKAPMFYHGRAYQGAEGHIYPYPFHDELTDKRIEKDYHAIYLENQYIKVCVLPEIGGRILYARDKSNGYDFIYHQHVIKPSLIGMLGAWISGGIEWDLPHHHRARVFEPVDYKIESNGDGSKTLWIGELELRDRMRWIIGLTVYPDKSYFEAEVKMFNQTPVANSFLSWANVATHATEDYQILFPPGTDYVTYHSKNQFTTWPETEDIWRGVDYTDGVDLSWWKNHPAPNSFFAWNYEDDFFGGYDHGKEAGIAYVANHHVASGKKFFLWGPGFGENTHGAMWNKILTEQDGPYVELMAGGYSDNQPDYCWLQPYETKSFKWHWYPIRQIKGMKQANLQGAVNIKAVSPDSIMVAANTTTPFENARLIIEQGDEILFNRSIDITPANPFHTFMAHPSQILQEDYHLKLLSSDGKELVTYHHEHKASSQKMPDPVEPPQTPEEIETVEELYLTGLRIEQFHNPSLEPYSYYEEALKRDPDNFRVNRSLGILYYKRGMMQEAEKHLVNAVDRITRKYTRPRDGEAHYYLGLTHKYLGKNQQAYDAFYRSTWDYRFNAPAFFQLAQLDCINSDFAKALDHIQRSMDANNRNYKAYALKAAILRHMERYEGAIDVARQALQKDPLHPWAGIELYLAQQEKSRRKARQTLEEMHQVLQANKDQTYLEVATHYMNCGLWQDGQNVLSEYSHHKDPRHPMIYYYMGYLHDQTGETGTAKQFYKKAASMSPDYCFPLRLESLKILNHVIDVHPKDERAHYYLGNLLFYFQKEDQAIAAWERSKDLNNPYVYTHRNLGMAYDSRKDGLGKAIRQYEQAIEIDNSDPRLFAELARLYQKAEVPFKDRLGMLESHKPVIELRDDALSMLVQIYIRTGKYDEAMDYLKNYHFRRWEGGGNIRNIYVNAYLMRGLDSYQHHNYPDALRDFEQALEYPDNIEAAKRYYGGRRGQIYYFMGMTHKKAGDQRQAEQAFKNAVSARKGGEASFQHYYEARALQKLGMHQKADKIFVDIIQNGKRELQQTGKLEFFAKFGEKQASDVQKAEAHFLTGIGYLGSGNREKAREEFEQALQLDMDHLWARYYLE